MHENMCTMRHLQVSDVKRLLIDVSGVGAGGQASDAGQVSAVTPHGLDDEHTPLRSTGGLLDAVASLAHAKGSQCKSH